MTATSFGFAFLAGILSVLSPCVLPLLPILWGAAAADHRLGPPALAGGLLLSFVAIGLFVATIGFAIGLDSDRLRLVAAVLMIGLGLVLAMPPLQIRFAAGGGSLADWAGKKTNGASSGSIGGQFGLGVLLGAAWSPCVGPTLGAASLLATQGRSLGVVAATMVFFGFGAALPLLLAGRLSRQALLVGAVDWSSPAKGRRRFSALFWPGSVC
jgi:cytochrome c biogenesis protein CcdA